MSIFNNFLIDFAIFKRRDSFLSYVTKVDRSIYYRLICLNPLAEMLFINSCLSFDNFSYAALLYFLYDFDFDSGWAVL